MKRVYWLAVMLALLAGARWFQNAGSELLNETERPQPSSVRPELARSQPGNSLQGVQLAYTKAVPALPAGGTRAAGLAGEPPLRAGRRLPKRMTFSELAEPGLAGQAVPIPEAETLAHFNFQQGRFGRWQKPSGEVLLFNPETLLVKFQSLPHVAILRVEPMRELESAAVVARRRDVAFAELDVLHERQYTPGDPMFGRQWHHQVIGSEAAWEHGLGSASVRIAIVDTPFQMDHPDLAAQVDPGWDLVAGETVTSAAGLAHSTLAAGLAAAVIGNDLGVAGVGNCRVLPINIEGYTSEMYDAVVWAADHGVRVVNISWNGANEVTLNEAGLYLKTKARGLLAMAGVNQSGYLDYPNHPHIYAISMTDAADNQRSRHGPHIDFAAPGYEVFSTTIQSGYGADFGTSYSTPVFCGVVAWLFSLNPLLEPDEVIELLRQTAVDLGPPGWDQWFGWGRVNFAGAARAAWEALPRARARLADPSALAISFPFRPGRDYRLWRTFDLTSPSWSPVIEAGRATNGDSLWFYEAASRAGAAFYRVEELVP